MRRLWVVFLMTVLVWVCSSQIENSVVASTSHTAPQTELTVDSLSIQQALPTQNLRVEISTVRVVNTLSNETCISRYGIKTATVADNFGENADVCRELRNTSKLGRSHTDYYIRSRHRLLI